MYPFFVVLFSLLFWHALADYPLQGDFIARAKSRTAPIPGINWWIILANHSLIHAFGVFIITGSMICGIWEFIMHFIIDDMKCRNKMSFAEDQFFHLICKLVWAASVMLLPNWNLNFGVLHWLVVS